MKILSNKTYRELMNKVNRAEMFFEALENNKVYTKPQKLSGERCISGCFFLMRDGSGPALKIVTPKNKGAK